MNPTVGRIVHYRSHGTPVLPEGQAYAPQCRAAVVTQVCDKGPYPALSLAVLNPGGQFFNRSVPADPSGLSGGTWHWAERENEPEQTPVPVVVTHLEIGGGTLVQPGFSNLDPVHGIGGLKRKAQDLPWPVTDKSVQSVRASHVVEHIPSGQVRIDVFNEVHRVLVPGGTFEVIVPFMTGSWHAIADPTHVSFWCKESFHYFDGLFAANADYGIRPWETRELHLTEDPNIGRWVGVPR